MVNTREFTARLELLLAHYELSAGSFADAIGVQRSSISHLLSGRNRPSLDFVMKVIACFPEVNLYWLLNGKGDFPPADVRAGIAPSGRREVQGHGDAGKAIERIVIFFSDGSFKTYRPDAGPQG